MTRTPSRWLLPALCLAVVVAVLRPSPALADEGTLAIPIDGLPPVVVNYGTDLSDTFNLQIPSAPPGSPQVATQCLDLSGVGGSNKLCVGQPSEAPTTPLTVQGLAEAAPVVKAGNDAATALAWMVPEALEYIRTTYDLPNDERILRYARSEIRAYMLNRLLDIMDKRVFGVALTDDEQRALDFVEDQYGLDDVTQAKAAYAEFQSFLGTGGCGYVPPAPPPGTPFKALALPKAVADACNNAQPVTAQAFAFAPPLPSVDDFTTWGAYAKAHALGLDAYANDAVKQNVARTTIASTVGAGIGGAIAGAALAGIVVGASEALAGVVVSAIGSSALATTWVAGTGSVAGTAAGVGAGAAAGIVGIVILSVVLIAISIWMVVQRESIGVDLKKRVDNATGADPLGLDALIPTYAGQPLRQGFTAKNLPAYRSANAISKLVGKIVQWTTVNPDSTVTQDATTLWSDNATTSTDRKFLVRVGTGAVQEQDSITVPQKNGVATVRFSRGWMIVKEPGEPERAQLDVGFRDLDGVDTVATRAPGAAGGWVVGQTVNGTFTGTAVDTISYKNAAGQRVRVQIKPLPYSNLSGPRPSAVGPMYAARVVNLRPNPVNIDGSTVPYVESQTDYGYEWTVTRFDEDQQEWVGVPSAGDGYGAKLTPGETGYFRAEVTMTRNDNPTVKKYGMVQFYVAPPPISAPTLAMVDNAVDRAEVDLQLTEPVPGDTITTTVTWPRELGATGPAPTTTVVQPCIQTGPLECTTQRTGPSDLLVRQLTASTDLRQRVDVTVTNQYGGVLTQDLTLDNPARPTFVAPPEGSNDGVPGVVVVNGPTAQVEVPVGDDLQAREYHLADLVSSAGGSPNFQLVDPVTGNTRTTVVLPDSGGMTASIDGAALTVRATPTVNDFGTYEVPILVSDLANLDTRNLFVVTVHVVPATRDRYRGGLQSEIDPHTLPALAAPPEVYPAVYGGLSDWGPYDGNLCVSGTFILGPPDTHTMCGPRSFFYGADGKVKPFPYASLFPEGLHSGTYRLTAWIPDVGDRVDSTPLTIPFILTDDVEVATPKASVAAEIRGTAKVGEKLRASAVTFPEAAGRTYQWLRDGKAVTGATASSYAVKAGDRGHRLSVRVRATATGYQAATVTSAQTGKVVAGTLTRTPVPTISGKADVGRRLTAAPGRWDAGVTLTYRWSANGKAIKGATGKRLTLTRALKGKRITVAVTGRKAGYAAVTRTSARTSRV